MDQQQIPDLLNETKSLDTVGFLSWALKTFGPQDDGSPSLAFASSLGLEDQLLLDWITVLSPGRVPDVFAFTLDTGRLPQETYDLLHTNKSRYQLAVVPFFPDAAAVEAFVTKEGPNSFYDSVEQRKACCGIRKVQPLKRALTGKAAWLTGLRSAQSVTRQALERIEWDSANGLVKLNPLAEWSLDQVRAEVKARKIPYNVLHDKGYPSIGCAPCSRAIKPGSDERAGRWWWENPAYKECGLHVDPAAPPPKFRFGGVPT